MQRLNKLEGQIIDVASSLKPGQIVNLINNNTKKCTDVFYKEAYLGCISKQVEERFGKIVQCDPLYKFFNFEINYLDITDEIAIELEKKFEENELNKNNIREMNLKRHKQQKQNEMPLSTPYMKRHTSNKYEQKEFNFIINEIESKKCNDKERIMLGYKFADFISSKVRLSTSITQDSKTITKVSKTIVAAHLNENDVLEAIKWAEQVKKLGINVEDIISSLNVIKEKQNGIQLDEIVDDYLLNKLAGLHKDLRAFKKAKALYIQSLKLKPNNQYTLNSLGGVCKEGDWFEEGIFYYNEALKLPSNKQNYSYNGLGAIYRKQKKHTLSENMYEMSLRLDEKDTFAHNGLGAVYIDIEDYERAHEHFCKAGNQKYLFELCEEFYEDNILEKAIKCLELILRSDPTNQKARQLLNRLTDEVNFGAERQTNLESEQMDVELE